MIKKIGDEILDITNLASNASLNAKVNEVKGEIPSIANLTTTSALANDENRIPNVSDLVKRVDCDAKISEMENNYFTTSD